jgi:hypothetical protein
MTIYIRRRDFIVTLGGAAAAWPLAAHAQQGAPMQRIGVLVSGADYDSEEQSRLAAFQQGLAKLGWTDGHNVRIDYRWKAGTSTARALPRRGRSRRTRSGASACGERSSAGLPQSQRDRWLLARS